MDELTRTCTLTVPAETAHMLRWRLAGGSDPSTAPAVWETTASDNGDDTVTVTATTGPALLRGHQVWGVHQRGSRPTPLDGVTAALADDLETDRCIRCGTRRAKRTWLLRHPDGTLLPVGENCLGAFLGAPHSHTTLVAQARDLARGPHHTAAWLTQRLARENRLDTTTVIAAALWACEQHGFVSMRKANATGRTSTSRDIVALLTGPGDLPAGVVDRLLPAAILRAWVLEEMPVVSEFDARLRATAARSAITRYHVGTLAPLPVLYRRAAQAQDALAAGLPDPGRAYAPGHAGPVGERIDLPEATFEQARTTDYGSTLVCLRSGDGHRLVWFASTAPTLPEPGSVVRVRGRVKAHRRYAETDETVLTRVSLTLEPAPAA